MDFKNKLVSEFNQPLSARDIFKKLESRFWNPKVESLHFYVLAMQEIARDVQIDDSELMEFILEGLRDKTHAISIFYDVTTINEFKKLIPCYEKIHAEIRSNVKAVPISNLRQNKEGIRCYNCSEFGHLAQDCKKERRPRGSCFKCGKMDHYYVNCPARMVAAVEDMR